VIGAPPSFAGAPNAMLAWLSPGVAAPIVGAPGAVATGVALTSSLPVALVLLLGWQGTHLLVISNGIVLRQQLTPDRLRSRVNTSARMIAWGGQPFGAAIGGAVAEVASIRATYLLMALGVGISATAGWLSPLRRADPATVARLEQEAEQAAQQAPTALTLGDETAH